MSTTKFGAKTKQQIEALKSAIAAHPKGASLDQILSDASPLGISRNTLIRRLNDMVSAGELTKAGLSRRCALQPSAAFNAPGGRRRGRRRPTF